MTCHFVATDQPRALIGRHLDGCDGDCKGCAPCPEPHCLTCYRNHATVTCTDCLNAARDDLHAIVRLCAELPDEAAARAGRSSAPGQPALGGEPMVLIGPVSMSGTAQILQLDHRKRLGLDTSHMLDELSGDFEPPLSVLAGWAHVWMDHLGQHTDLTATIRREADYLGSTMHYMAQITTVPFDEFARALRQCRSHLEDELHDGDRKPRGAPCVHCQTMLERNVTPRTERGICDGHHLPGAGWHEPSLQCPVPRPEGCCDRGGADDEWVCPKCHRRYDPQAYSNAVAATYKAHAPALPADDMHDQLGVPKGSLRAWASMGKIRKRGKDINGRVLYDVADTMGMMKRTEGEAS